MANSPTAYRPQFTTTNMDTAFAEFVARYPSFDADTLADLRATEYSRLDTQQQVYLDYTGGGLYGDSQLESHLKILREGVFGNPHSSNPTSKASTELDEHSRDFVLEYFNASPDEYVAIFTQNASGALKLVGESYPFTSGGHYLLTFDNHNSVNGIREFARAKGATLTYAPVLPPDLRIDAAKLDAFLEMADPAENNLFAYPAQSNFSGVQHDLEWIEKAQSKGWNVLLDVAAFVPTNCLDLSRWHPDFVTLSFYKMFGYPTGIGCLIARKSALEKLIRPWFAGGTITIASVEGDGHYLAEDEAGFEDGTIDYLNWPAVEIGLKHLKSIGIDTIHERVTCLTNWLIDNLMALFHSNGNPLIHLYGPANTEMRGGTVTINFRDKNGRLYEFQEIEARANQVNISLRTGCFCNPGAGENALGITKEDLADCYGRDERMTFEQFVQAMHGKGEDAIGAVRISVGVATNFADAYRFMQFAESFIDAEAAG
jgi:selenocysteine lyase/cysteine desulfurase